MSVKRQPPVVITAEMFMVDLNAIVQLDMNLEKMKKPAWISMSARFIPREPMKLMNPVLSVLISVRILQDLMLVSVPKITIWIMTRGPASGIHVQI